MSERQLNYFGLLKSPSSWARVGRETILALDALGVAVSVAPTKGFGYGSDFPLPARLQALINSPAHFYNLDLTFCHPDNYEKLGADKKAAIITYEAERLPSAWGEKINKHLDVLFVPSRYVYDAAVKSGVSIPLYIIPHGVNRSVFYPRALPQNELYTFLCCATPHIRKGLVELLDSYKTAFSPADPVRLIIKTPPYIPAYPKLKRWDIPDLQQRVDALTAAGYNVELRASSLSDEELAVLINAADICVQPSYGEGFGLSILEAMSCGKPIITTGYGGSLEYCTPENAVLIPAMPITTLSAVYDADEMPPATACPDRAALSRALYSAYDRKARENSAGEHTAGAYSWENSAKRLIDACENERII